MESDRNSMSEQMGVAVSSRAVLGAGGQNLPPAVTIAVLATGSATGLIAVVAVIACCRCCFSRGSVSGFRSKMPKKRQSSDSSSYWLDDQYSSSMMSGRCQSSMTSLYRHSQQQQQCAQSIAVHHHTSTSLSSMASRATSSAVDIPSNRTSSARPLWLPSSPSSSRFLLPAPASSLAALVESKESARFEVAAERTSPFDSRHRARPVTAGHYDRSHLNKRVERRHTEGEFRQHHAASILTSQAPPRVTSSAAAPTANTSAAIANNRLPSDHQSSCTTSNATLLPPTIALNSANSVSEAENDSANSATELTPMLLQLQQNDTDACGATPVPKNKINHCSSSTAASATATEMTTCNLESCETRPAETEQHRQTVVVEVYRPINEGPTVARRPVSLQQFIGGGCAGVEGGIGREGAAGAVASNLMVTSSTSPHSTSAPDLRVASTAGSSSNDGTQASSENVKKRPEPTNFMAAFNENLQLQPLSQQKRYHQKRIANRSCQAAVSLPSLLPTHGFSAERSQRATATAAGTELVVLSLPDVGKMTTVTTTLYNALQHPCTRRCPSLPSVVQRIPVCARPFVATASHAVTTVDRLEQITATARSAPGDGNAAVSATADDSCQSTTAVAAASSSSRGRSNSCHDASTELWNLRALLANRDDDCSVEESVDDDQAATVTASATSTASTTTPQSADDGSAKSSDTVVSVVEVADVQSDKTVKSVSASCEPNSSGVFGEVSSNTTAAAAAATSAVVETASTTAPAAAVVPDDGLRREPSIRRQTYRNAIARRNQQKNQQRLQTDNGPEDTSAVKTGHMSPSAVSATTSAGVSGSTTVTSGLGSTVNSNELLAPNSGDVSSEVTDNESSLSFERHYGLGGYLASISAAASSIDTANSSFRDSVTSNDSVGGYSSCSGEGQHGNHRLEHLRGDSGYRSLETQQSLAAAVAAGACGGSAGGAGVGSARDFRRPSAAGSLTVNDVIREDDGENIASPTVAKQMSSTSTLTDGTPTSSAVLPPPVRTVSGSPKQHHESTSHIGRHHSKAAERKRIQYKCDRQAVQVFESIAGETVSCCTTNQPAATSASAPASMETSASPPACDSIDLGAIRYRKPQSEISSGGEADDSFDDGGRSAVLSISTKPHHQHQQQHQQQKQHRDTRTSSLAAASPLSSSAASIASKTSSFFSRLLRSSPTTSGPSPSFSSSSLSSRRAPPTLVRMHQRDYSIDERSDAIFNEFVRHDPAYESRHSLCVAGVSRRRSSGGVGGGHRTHNRRRHPDERSPTERRHRLRRHDGHGSGQQIDSVVGGSSSVVTSTSGPLLGITSSISSAVLSPSTAVAGPKNLLLSGELRSPSASTMLLLEALASRTQRSPRNGGSTDDSRRQNSACDESAVVSTTRIVRPDTMEILSVRTGSSDLGAITTSDIGSSEHTSSNERSASSDVTSHSAVDHVTAEAMISSPSNTAESLSNESPPTESGGVELSPPDNDIMLSVTSSNGGATSTSSRTRNIPVIQLTTDDDTI